MMVPCSAIGMAIVAVVTRTAPWLKPTAPTVETVRSCRFELRYVEEASSARRVAGAYKVRGIGFDETTKLGEGALTSNVTIEPTEGAPLEDVIMRAAYCPLGGTSEKVVSSINLKCFARLRDMLRRWECKFYEMYPEDTWTGPDPSRLGLHQLGGGGAIQSDTCNGARCAKRLLAELVAKEVEADCGAGRECAGRDRLGAGSAAEGRDGPARRQPRRSDARGALALPTQGHRQADLHLVHRRGVAGR
mmetsp:Transcript_84439/g.168619  ORF Transcript_84439/g.168619 Transcript_84439/m.168619 type:complete len:247 (-) Transcript_84439:353-1093(-)